MEQNRAALPDPGVVITGADGVEALLPSLNLIRRRSPDDRARIRVGPAEFGGGEFVIIAGPCAVECERQVMETAEAVARSGATILRGGAFKPRTSPYSFQGWGIQGLKLLRQAADKFGLAVVSEAMSDSQVDIVAEYADMIQIGARSMENAALLTAVCRSSRPVLLKRGLASTLEELLEAAEFLASKGKVDVVLCERGIRTYGRLTRNTCDLAAVAVLNEITRLPVVIDPSHATGRRSLVPPVARAAVAIGADGLMVEVHPSPDQAWSDGEQSLTFQAFESMCTMLAPHLELWEEARAACAPEASAV